MKTNLRNAAIAAGLAFATTPFMPSDAEACKVTVYAREGAPLQNVPKKHSKSYYWETYGFKLQGNSKFGKHAVGTSFISAANACAKHAADFKKSSGATKATWEMPVCILDRPNKMSPAARKRWTGEVEQVCFIEHTVK